MPSPLQQILVHVDAGPAAPGRLALARELARQHEASVVAAYAATPAYLEATYAPSAAAIASGPNQIDGHRLAVARQRFDGVFAEPGPKAEWTECEGLPLAAAFARRARYADLVVLGQRDAADPFADGVPADFPESVVEASGRAALVVPFVHTPHTVGRTVLVAWKESPECVRAVTAAMPLLRRAEMVHVLTWAAEDEPKDAGARLATYLRGHGIAVTAHAEGPPPAAIGEVLLSRVDDLGADLLVMGCYGHSRAREWLLGGATRTVLRSMTVPVLMAH